MTRVFRKNFLLYHGDFDLQCCDSRHYQHSTASWWPWGFSCLPAFLKQMWFISQKRETGLIASESERDLWFSLVKKITLHIEHHQHNIKVLSSLTSSLSHLSLFRLCPARSCAAGRRLHIHGLHETLVSVAGGTHRMVIWKQDVFRAHPSGSLFWLCLEIHFLFTAACGLATCWMTQWPCITFDLVTKRVGSFWKCKVWKTEMQHCVWVAGEKYSLFWAGLYCRVTACRDTDSGPAGWPALHSLQ